MKRFIILLILFLSASAYAQKDTMNTSLSEIVVSATRTATSSIRLASSFTLINSADIESKQKLSVIDLLREVPGLSVARSGGIGTMSNVFLRGANPYHTLVIMDGAVLNDPSSPSGAYDFASLFSDNIERIEIVRGPQSTLYGSDAIAGIINIFSRRPETGFNLRLNAETGSNSLYKGNLTALGTLGKLSYTLNYLKMKTEGISAASSRYGNSERDGFENNIFSSNLGYDILPNLSASLIYRYTKSYADLDQNEKLGDDINFKTDFEEHLVRGTINYDMLQGKWESVIGFSNVRKISHTTDGKDAARPEVASAAFNNAARTKYDWQNNLKFIDNNLITIGMETEVEKANSNYSSESMWGPYYSEFAEQSIRTTGIFVQDQFTLGGLNGTAGFRYDNNNKFGGEFTFRIAPAYLINSTGTKLKATYGTGFKAPSLFYLFDPMFGNTELKPEKSEGWDAGIEQFLMDYRLSLGITYFSIRFNDMFGMDKNYKTVNINKAESNGVEAYLNYSVPQSYSVRVNYTYTYAVDKSDESPEKDLLLIRRPMHKASLEVNYNPFEEININGSAVYVGEREDKDFSDFTAVRRTLPDYTLFNIAASYKLSRNISLQARLENVFDKYFEDILYYGTMGRNFALGISLNY